MPSVQRNDDLRSYFEGMPFGGPKVFLETQEMALVAMQKLGALSYNYTMELNKTWLSLCKDQLSHYAAWPQRLAASRTPDEVVSVYADLIGQATQDYKQGFDRLAAASSEMAKETEKALESGQDAAREMVEKTAKAVRKGGKSDISEEARQHH
jgi:hypothetical protein